MLKSPFLVAVVLLFLFSPVAVVRGQAIDDIISAPNFEPINLRENVELISTRYDQAIGVSNAAESSAYTIKNLKVIDFNDTSVTIQWNYDVSLKFHSFPSNLIIELATGRICEDFIEIANILADPVISDIDVMNTNLFTQTYLVNNLEPSSYYRVRIVPVFVRNAGRGFPSSPLLIYTMASPINYWEQIFPRRTSKIWYGRGFSDPVAARPHLSEGVEIFSEDVHSDRRWWTDAPTLRAPVLPSGRRGHTLTLVDNYVYMFGGRSNGYSCASTLIDTLNLGNEDSGLPIFACVSAQYEVNELWAFDISSYEWKFINTSAFALPYNTSIPPRRELHSATVANRELYIFGGRSRIHPINANGQPIMTNKSDLVYNDLWKLQIDYLKPFTFDWNIPLPISQTERTPLSIDATPTMIQSRYPLNPFISVAKEGISPRSSQCIKDIMLEVKFYHDCINQLRFTFQISGPVQGSPNFFPNNNHEIEILLLSRVPTDNTTNCIAGEYTFVFHDRLNDQNNNLDHYYLQQQQPPLQETTLPYEDPTACCFNPNQKVHYYYSQGLLSEILDNSLVNRYSILTEDLVLDSLQGNIISARVYLQSISCMMRYQWQPVTYSAVSTYPPPVPRYQANILSYNHSIFIFGGKNVDNDDLKDIYRYDITSRHWYQLLPSQFYENPFTSGNAIGSNYLLTSFGIIRYGGYFRQSYLKNLNPCASKSGGDGGVESDLCIFNSQHRVINTKDGNSNYDQNVYIMNPITLKWELLDIRYISSSTTDQLRTEATSANTNLTRGNNFFFYQTNYDQRILQNLPNNRYYASMVFIPSNSLQWKQQQLQVNLSSSDQLYDVKERILYDGYQIAAQGNYQSYASDSILLFGGFDGATGSMVDGSSSGFLQDTWMLRLNRYSTKAYRQSTLQYIQTHCQWRYNPSATNKFGTNSCLSTATPKSANCRLRDLLLLAWCSQYNQTLA